MRHVQGCYEIVYVPWKMIQSYPKWLWTNCLPNKTLFGASCTQKKQKKNIKTYCLINYRTSELKKIHICVFTDYMLTENPPVCTLFYYFTVIHFSTSYTCCISWYLFYLFTCNHRIFRRFKCYSQVHMTRHGFYHTDLPKMKLTNVNSAQYRCIVHTFWWIRTIVFC